MKITIASDLHADFPQEKIFWSENDGVLIVAGDTGNSLGTTLRFIKKAAASFRNVVVVDGNHEHYNNVSQNRSIDEALNSLEAQFPENVFFLREGKDFFEREGFAFIGCNGWYTGDFIGNWQENSDLWKSYMNDFRCTFNTPKQEELPIDLALRDYSHISYQLDQALLAGLRPIVVTHTAPTRHALWQKPWDTLWQTANGWYFNSYNEKLLEKHGEKIELWIHGHIHQRNEKVIDGVRIIANPRGYPGELSKWTPLEIEV